MEEEIRATKHTIVSGDVNSDKRCIGKTTNTRNSKSSKETPQTLPQSLRATNSALLIHNDILHVVWNRQASRHGRFQLSHTLVQ